MRLFILSIIFFVPIVISKAQTPDQTGTEIPETDFHVIDFGIGTGFDYGGTIGAKLALYGFEYASVFASFGYYKVGPGINLGIQCNFVPHTNEHLLRPHVKLMYGTNSVIMVQPEYYNPFSNSRTPGKSFIYNDKSYSGMTIGGGFEIRAGTKKHHGFDIDFCIAIRSQDYKNDCKEALTNINYTIINQSSFSIGLGYHYEFW